MLSDPSRGMKIKLAGQQVFWGQQEGKWNLLNRGEWRTGSPAHLPKTNPVEAFPNAQKTFTATQLCGNQQVHHTVVNNTTHGYFNSILPEPIGLFCWCSAKAFEVSLSLHSLCHSTNESQLWHIFICCYLYVSPLILLV